MTTSFSPSSDATYVVATIRPWNIEAFHTIISKYPGHWHLITQKNQLTPQRVEELNPRYIFFPHWSHMVPKEILEQTECVCFHETDLPFGRGGSPIQNLIARGVRQTKISALQMMEELDAGPIYMKRPLSLDGSAEQIYRRASVIVAEMIGAIASQPPIPTPQIGQPIFFRRRTPSQSEMLQALNEALVNHEDVLERIYDHIRMLDAPEYPHAFADVGPLRITFSDATLDGDEIHAKVSIVKRQNDD